MAGTIDKVALLRPDRIAFYSYAHVPCSKPSQRGYSEKDLPTGPAKRALYELVLQKLQALGYLDIGKDHFALPEDALYLAQQTGQLHRNFLGYTTCHTNLLIGLGASSISDAKYAYLQNEKTVEDYKAGIAAGNLAITKGHLLTPEDLLRKKALLKIVCKGELAYIKEVDFLFNKETRAALLEMEEEGLLTLHPDLVKVTPLGQAFVRNICMLFDQKVKESKQEFSTTFSKAI